MKIIVAIRQVPARDSLLKTASSGAWIEEEDLSFEINEADAYALEAGLQLKEAAGGEVVVLCAGPETAGQTIREALAKGADRAIHVELADQPGDPLALAKILAAAIGEENADVILTGLQSDDYGYGQTGVVLAEVLGLPHASLVMSVEATDSGLRVKRELEGGWFENVDLPTPALLTIQSGAAKLRYATLMGIKKAKTKEVRAVDAAPVSATSLRVTKVYAPDRSRRAVIFDGAPKEAAAALVEKLRFEARCL